MNAAINTNHVDDGAKLILSDAIANRAFAVDLPLMHFAERANHGEVHHRARLVDPCGRL